MSYCPKVTWSTGLNPNEKQFWAFIQKGDLHTTALIRKDLMKKGFDPMDDYIMLQNTYEYCIIDNNLHGIKILTESRMPSKYIIQLAEEYGSAEISEFINKISEFINKISEQKR